MRGTPLYATQRTADARVALQVPLSPFDNALAIDQMEVAYSTLLQRDVARDDTVDMVGSTWPFAKDNKEHPKIVTYVSPSPPHLVHSLRFLTTAPASVVITPFFSPS